MTIARTGFGITVDFANGFFAEITEFTPPEMTREAIPAPYTTTPNGAIEKIMSDLIDYGESSVEIHFDETATPPINQPFELVVINFPSGRKWSFLGAMSNYSSSTPIDDRSVATVTLVVSGEIDFNHV